MISYNIEHVHDYGRSIKGTKAYVSNDPCIGENYLMGRNGSKRPVIRVTKYHSLPEEYVQLWNSILNMCGLKIPRSKMKEQITITIPTDGVWAWRQLPYQLYRQLGERIAEGDDYLNFLERWWYTIRYSGKACRLELLYLLLVELRLTAGHGFAGVYSYDWHINKYKNQTKIIHSVWNNAVNDELTNMEFTRENLDSTSIFKNKVGVREGRYAYQRTNSRWICFIHLMSISEKDWKSACLSDEARDTVARSYKKYGVQQR